MALCTGLAEHALRRGRNLGALQAEPGHTAGLGPAVKACKIVSAPGLVGYLTSHRHVLMVERHATSSAEFLPPRPHGTTHHMPNLPDRTVMYVHVSDFKAVYRDTSYLDANRVMSEPLDGTGLPLEPDDVAKEAVRQSARFLDAIKSVDTKTPPSTYEFGVVVRADYPDGRGASREVEFRPTDPSTIADAVMDWCGKVVPELVRIGNDDI